MNTKYIKYATGEIVLVVIGILIALQVNNWNENRLKNKKIIQYLIQIQDELTDDLKEAQEFSIYFEQKDEYLVKVLRGELTANDYSSNPDLRFLINAASNLVINEDGYKGLMEIIDEQSFSNKKLIKDLKFLHVELNSSFKIINDIFLEEAIDFEDHIIYNYDWAYTRDPILKELTNEEIEYLLTNPIYKNHVHRYREIGVLNVLRSSQNIELTIANLYSEISKITNQPIPDLVQQYLTPPKKGTFEQILGEYKDEKAKLHIELLVQNDSLIFKDLNREFSIHLLQVSKDRYFFGNGEAAFHVDSDSTFHSITAERYEFTRVNHNE